ncbi:MAG: hypothetical protein ACEQSF_03805 [Solirubrobacteraceae bacterium]
MFLLFGLYFFSCNKEDENPEKTPQEQLVPLNTQKVISKIKYKFIDPKNAENSVDNESIEFKYTNNQVTEVNHSELGIDQLTYSGNKLIEITDEKDPNWKTIFEYSGDNVIKISTDESRSEFFYDASNKVVESRKSYAPSYNTKYTTKYFYEGKNLVRIESAYSETTFKPFIKNIYHGKKYNPYINHNKYFKYFDFDSFVPSKKSFNENLEIYSSIGSEPRENYESKFEYDSDDFFTRYFLK